jgi:hypothetical protein
MNHRESKQSKSVRPKMITSQSPLQHIERLCRKNGRGSLTDHDTPNKSVLSVVAVEGKAMEQECDSRPSSSSSTYAMRVSSLAPNLQAQAASKNSTHPATTEHHYFPPH